MSNAQKYNHEPDPDVASSHLLIDRDFLDQSKLAGQADEEERHAHDVASNARHDDPS